MASAAQAHLHSLSFPLSQLDRLSSLELALIQFHLDNDDKAFSSTVREARRVWRRRRRGALEAGELLEGERPVAPARPRLPPPSVAKSTESPAAPPVPLQFRALAQSIRAATKARPFGGIEPGPLASQIGSGLKAKDPQIYQRNPKIKTFKDLQAAAVKLGIIESGKGGTAGRDWVQLTEPYRLTDTPLAAPLRVSPPPPPLPPAADLSIPLPSPLPPSLFHLANLEFDPHLEDLDSLPTHHLLLLQFRDDVEATGWTAESDRLWTRIERVFWRRRAAAYERGERWSNQLPVGHPLTRELGEALPSAIVSQLHAVQVDDLPDARVSNVTALAALLPAHLQFVCATVSTASLTSHTRTAHLGFRSAKVAAAAQRFFAELQIGPGSTGLSARTLPPSSSSSRWRWMDVRPDERLGLWHHHVDLVASGSRATPVKRSYFGDDITAGDRSPEVKKPRYSVEPPWPRSASLATEARRGVEQTVRADDPVPAELLGPTFPAVLLHQKPPRDLQIEHTCDDAWIHRFHADGYMVIKRQVYLCFSTGSDRRVFGEWVKTTASRYWKKNGLAIKSLLPNEIVDFGWQFGHFSPAWRRRHGFRLADTAPHRPTVGELGFGRDAVPDSVELGWFPFEYILDGRDQPPADLLPPRVALAAARWPSHAPSEPLAARLGDGPGRSGSLAASISSAWDRRTSTPAGALNGEDLFAATEDPAFLSVKEEEDAEMKPSAEELRRAEELAAAVRINILGSASNTSTAVVEASDPRETADMTAPSTPLPPFASAIQTPVSLTGSPPPVGGVTLVHVAEQQAAPSRLRRVTAMELMDFEDELEDFTASVAEALGSSMSPPAADPAAEPVAETGSKLPIVSAPLQDGVDERIHGFAEDPIHDQVQHAVISQHAPDATVQTHSAAESTSQRDVAADLPPTNPTPPTQHDLSLPASFATSNESGGSSEPAQPPTAEGPIPSLASSSAPAAAIAVSAADTAVQQQEAPTAARVVPQGLTRHSSYGDGVSSLDAPASARMEPVRTHSNGATFSSRQPLASSGLLGLPVKPSFAMDVPRDNTLW